VKNFIFIGPADIIRLFQEVLTRFAWLIDTRVDAGEFLLWRRCATAARTYVGVAGTATAGVSAADNAGERGPAGIHDLRKAL
jgi:hypothetical protein